MSRIDALLTRKIQCLHDNLLLCQQQLPQLALHPEALHELRVNLRQLRSLLRPLHHFPEISTFDVILKRMIDQSNSVRDTEVLVAELKHKQETELYNAYQQQLLELYEAFVQQNELELIIQRLITLPWSWQHPSAPLPSIKLKKHIVSYHKKMQKKLKDCLKNKEQSNKHRLRLLIKRLRYTQESYGQFLTVKPKTQAQLKTSQDVLGDWHDRWVWLEKGKTETAFQCLVPVWQQEMADFDKAANKQLAKLQAILKKVH